ncbi:MAG TPA: extracellular solute-binding protein [Pseudogracilibacillus sp.]|nr:extracellular solute-binding protein [Pseudogracilibacillus sp.]
MNKSIKFFIAIIGILTLFTIAACSGDTGENSKANNDEEVTEKSGELVVYSSRNEKFMEPLLEKFEKESGITVNLLSGKDEIINKVKEEGKNAHADILISNDVGALEHLRQNDFLQGYDAEGIESIDEKYRAEDNSWYGLSARTRILMYNKDLITEEEMPKTIAELADDKWKDEFAITRGGNGSMIAHVSALRNEWGDDKTLEWLKNVKDNAAVITDGHGDLRRAVGAGEVKMALVNNYYYHQQLDEPTDNNVGAIYPDQGEDDMGAFVNAAGVGFINNAPNEDNAKTFLDWLMKPENQREFSYASMEVPINPDIEPIEEAAKISDYKISDMPLRDLGNVWENTRELIEKSGLDLEIGS